MDQLLTDIMFDYESVTFKHIQIEDDQTGIANYQILATIKGHDDEEISSGVGETPAIALKQAWTGRFGGEQLSYIRNAHTCVGGEGE